MVIFFYQVVVYDLVFIVVDGCFGVFIDWIEIEFDNKIELYIGFLGEFVNFEFFCEVVVEVNGKCVEVCIFVFLYGVCQVFSIKFY